MVLLVMTPLFIHFPKFDMYGYIPFVMSNDNIMNLLAWGACSPYSVAPLDKGPLVILTTLTFSGPLKPPLSELVLLPIIMPLPGGQECGE